MRIETPTFIMHAASLYYLTHITNVWGCMEILPTHCGAGSVKVNYNIARVLALHRRKMSTHGVQKMTHDRFRVMSLAPRRKCPRNVVQMKVAMAAFFGSDSVANFLPL